MFRFRSAATAIAVLALLASSASAAVTGNLSVGTGGNATITVGALTFNNDPSANLFGNLGFNATGEVAAGTNLTFVGGPLNVTEGINIQPVTGAPVPSFMTFAVHPALVFSLAAVGAGSANTNCATVTQVGDSCSVFAGSPVVLTLQSNNSTSAAFTVSGKASDAGTVGLPGGSNYSGQFSATLTAALPTGLAPTPANLQAYFCPGGVCNPNTALTTPYSGTFTTSAVPEPSAMGLVGFGLLCACYAFRGKKSEG